MDTAADTVQRAARRTLPTGTVTFLFTDIEGSTQRWESHPEAMSVAVARHDELMRSAIEAHGGYVFKTVGDAFCASFQDTGEAVAAALDAQRALNAEDFSAVDGLRVRMALHTGLADERDGDYFGPAVNRAARLLAIGHGGQLLVSGLTADLVYGLLPEQSTLRDLGEHRLKDLTQPERVHQLVAPDLPAEFPPLRSLATLKNNLPQQLTRLIGREDDVKHIRELLAHHRLVTLTGAGGVGKTRLALQIGAEELDAYRGGVWLVELAPLSNPLRVASQVAMLFGVTAPSQQGLIDVLTAALKSKSLLLIFDNCEHLIDASARLADALLDGCPRVRIVATSREALRVGGEQLARVPSLPVPDAAHGLTTHEALDFAAVALFVERAAAADEHFTLTDANAAVVAEICRHLDGIALAIELAAARVGVLDVKEIATRLTDRFHLLTGGGRTVLARHKTLHALIDWSYDLLSEPEKALFRRLAVFAGTFDLDAASAVCAGEGVGPYEVLDLVSSLVDKSLLAAEASADKKRFRLLETTRQYARERLEQAGESDQAARRHAKYYYSVAERVKQRLAGPADASLALLDPDFDNCRAVLDWAFSGHGDAELGAVLADWLKSYWEYRGLYPEGLETLDRALSALGSDTETPDVVRVLNAISMFALNLSQPYRALQAAERAVAIATKLGETSALCPALTWKGVGLGCFGRYDDAALALEEARALLRPDDPWHRVGGVLNAIAHDERRRGNFHVSRKLFTELRESGRAHGDDTVETASILNLANTEFVAGDALRAIALAREALPMARKLSDKLMLATLLDNLATYLLAVDEVADARMAARESIELCRASGYASSLQTPLENLALCAALSGRLRRATQLVGFTEAALRALSSPRAHSIEDAGYDRLMAVLSQNLPAAELATLMAEGAAMSEDRAIEEALSV